MEEFESFLSSLACQQGSVKMAPSGLKAIVNESEFDLINTVFKTHAVHVASVSELT